MGGLERNREAYGTDIRLVQLFHVTRGPQSVPQGMCKKHRDKIHDDISDGRLHGSVLSVSNYEGYDFCSNCALMDKEGESK